MKENCDRSVLITCQTCGKTRYNAREKFVPDIFIAEGDDGFRRIRQEMRFR